MAENLPAIPRRQFFMGILSYSLWGFFPIYWKFLKHFSATEILAHRFVWSFVFYGVVYYSTVGRGSIREKTSHIIAQSSMQWKAAALSALLLGINWLIYIYAVNSGHIVEGSLAYFINPLMNVAVGVLFFKEAFPRPLQAALLLAVIGVAYRMAFASQFPWIALSLATTFCVYGVVKKKIKINPELSSFMEGTAGIVPAVIAVLYFRAEATTAVSVTDWLLFIGSGAVTGLPLYLFSAAAQKLPYSLLGMMQFIAPTLQFMCGVLMFGEVLEPSAYVSFALIWLGAGIYFFFQLQKLRSR